MIARRSGFVTSKDYQRAEIRKASMYVTESAAADSEFEIDRCLTQAPLKLLAVAASFDVPLGQRFLQRRLNGCYLFRRLIFFHRRFCTLDCCLGRSNVDLLGFKGHVS